MSPKRWHLQEPRTLTAVILLGIGLTVVGVIVLAAAFIIGGGARWPLWGVAVALLLASTILNGIVLRSARRRDH